MQLHNNMNCCLVYHIKGESSENFEAIDKITILFVNNTLFTDDFANALAIASDFSNWPQWTPFRTDAHHWFSMSSLQYPIHSRPDQLASWHVGSFY